MEWLELLKGPLASTPIAAVLAFATWRLWLKNEAKDAEIARLNQARIDDLKEIAKLDD